MSGRGTWRVGRLAGIPIGVHPLWLVIVGLMTWSLGASYFPDRIDGIDPQAAYALGLGNALFLFAAILLHELGHAVVARRRGLEVQEIDLWLLGGVARMSGDVEHAQDELRFAIAGPAVTAVIGVVLGALRLSLGSVAPDWVIVTLDYQLTITALILGFNMLPAFPLDGGRVLRALLWQRSGDHAKATRRAAGIGHGFGVWLIVLGLLSSLTGAIGGIWLVLVGWFLVIAGRAELQNTETQELFAGVTVADLMTPEPVCVRSDLTLQQAITGHVVPHLHGGYPVVDTEGRTRGVLTLRTIRAIPPVLRDDRFALQDADQDPQLLVDPALPIPELLARPAFARTGRAVAVGECGEPLGIVSHTDVAREGTIHSLLEGRSGVPLRR